jgi:hypothetical protein
MPLRSKLSIKPTNQPTNQPNTTTTQLHETVFAVVFRMVRPYLFLLQMGQLPLIYMGRKLKNTYHNTLPPPSPLY